MNKEEKEANKKYNTLAKFYHNTRTKEFPNGFFFNEMLEMPATFELLGNVINKTILDFGCGSGIYAKRLTKQGARVKGFDISDEMLNIAKKENPGLDLRLGSGYKIPFKEKFDIVIAPLVLDYLDNWDKAFQEVSKVLKTGGYFIFSHGNPVAECREKVKVGKKEYKVLGLINYFKETAHYANWKYFNKSISMPSYHKTYETIIKTIINNGFEIVNYKDTYPIPQSKKKFPQYYKICSKIPYFSVWKVKKK